MESPSSVITGISELPSSDIISPQTSSPPSLSPRSPSSKHIHAGYSSNEEKDVDFECRIQVLESTVKQQQSVLKKQEEQIKAFEERLQFLRHRRSFKKAIADLFLGSSSSSSQKSRSRSQSSVETDSEEGQPINNWKDAQVSPRSDGHQKTHSQGLPSSPDQHVVEIYSHPTKHNTSPPELMNTEKVSPVEMMDTASPVEMSAERRRTLASRPPLEKMPELRFGPQSRVIDARPQFLATSSVSPSTSSGFINSPFASNSHISPTSSCTPLAIVPTWSPMCDSLHHSTIQGACESPGDGAWPKSQPSQTINAGNFSSAFHQYIELDSSHMVSSGVPTSQSTSYFAASSPNSQQVTGPESALMVHCSFSGAYGNNDIWQESPILRPMPFLDQGEHIWNSPTTHGEANTMNSFPAVFTDAEGGYSTEESRSTDGSPVETVYGQSPVLSCEPCGFYPIAGPDQRKKLEKHKKTIKHSRKTGKGIVDTFPCDHCAATYTRRDNLVQHQKSHFQGTQAEVDFPSATAFNEEVINLGHGMESLPLGVERPKKRRRRSSLMSPRSGE